jgi:AmmeMemoRadiSam system protein B
MGDIRNQIERGWYPDNYSVLTKSLERYLKNVSTDKPEGKLIAIIVPHAGHKYSGQVAAYAFNCLEGMEFETVVVVSPFHYPHTGNIVTTSHMAYKTPLGLIDVDTHMLNDIDSRIKEKLGKGLSYISNDGEHAIEVELPFLQHLLSDFKLVPLMISNQTFKVARALGHAVSEAISNRNALLVASSDLSHYFPEEMANSFDSEMLRLIENFDPKGVIEADEQKRGFACGKAAISSVLFACRDIGASNIKVLKYSTSGDVTGDYDQVVGYGSAVIWKY